MPLVQHYDEVDYNNVVLPAGMISPMRNHVFGPQLKSVSTPLIRQIATTSTKPSWESPSPQTHAQLVADLQLYIIAVENPMLNPGALWQCTILYYARGILVRKAGEAEWCLPLCTLGGVAAIGWPVTPMDLGASGTMFMLKSDVSPEDLRWLFITDLKCWHAWDFEWVGKHRLAACGKETSPGAYCLCDGAHDTLWKAAARKCFYHIPKTPLIQFAMFMGVDVTSSFSIFQVLVALINAALPGISNEDLSDIMALRSQVRGPLDELMQTPEAIELLDASDQKAATEMHKDLEEEEGHKQDFLN